MINTVLFDMGGTLEDIWYNDQTIQDVTRKLLTFLQEHDMVTGSNEICFWNKINNGIRRYKQWSEGNALELKPEEIWPQYYLSEFDLDKEKVARYAEDMAGLWEVTYYHRELRPGVKEALEELKNKGYRLGVISNTASRYSMCWRPMESATTLRTSRFRASPATASRIRASSRSRCAR